MKRKSCFVLLLRILVGAFFYPSFSGAAPPCAGDSTADCWDSGTEFTGKINERYPVQMQLKWDEKNVTGYMFYESTASYLMLEGTRDSKGHAIIKEKDKQGDNTGLFEGELNEERFSGTWSTPDKRKQMPFKLTAAQNLVEMGAGQYSCQIKEKYFGQSFDLTIDQGKVSNFRLFSIAGRNAHDCELTLSDLKQERGKSYQFLLPDGKFEAQSTKLYGDRKERIRIKETPDAVTVQFFGYWRHACGLNGFMADMLINKKTKKCKVIQ